MAPYRHFYPITARVVAGDKSGMSEIEDPRHNLRMPPELKRKLMHARADSGRSMNAEIVARLEQSFQPNQAERFAEVLKDIAELTDEDRREAGLLLAGLGAILSKGTRLA